MTTNGWQWNVERVPFYGKYLDEVERLLATGWEPFAATSDAESDYLWLRRMEPLP